MTRPDMSPPELEPTPPDSTIAAEPRRSFFSLVARFTPVTIVFLIALLFTFTRAISERIFSDEQLFLGGAGLMARGEGLIYRDFFYNHMPTHALVLATLFKLTKHWTLAARTLDAACGAALVALLFEAGRRLFVAAPTLWRTLLSASVAAVFLFNPVTADAVGKAWNHDLAALSCVAGFVVLAAGLKRERATMWVITSGVLAAIAVTSRLTFAPPLLAFVLFIATAPGRSFVARVKLLTLFSLGALIGAAPALLVFAQAPANAYFENVKFPGLTTRYQGELQRGARDTFFRKLDFIQRVGAKSWALHVFFWLAIASALVAQTFLSVIRRPQAGMPVPQHARPLLWSTIVLVLAATVAAFVPTPMFNQYLYGPLPFAALLIIVAIASARLERFWITRILVIALAIVCVMSAKDQYDDVALLATPSKWSPNLARRDGKRLARLAAPGKVLTFLPGLAMEAGLPIYDGLSIGRYAHRIADYLTPGQRQKMNVPDTATMRKWFEEDRPGAVLLTDPASPLEAKIAHLAIEFGYTPHEFGVEKEKMRIVYLPPRP